MRSIAFLFFVVIVLVASVGTICASDATPDFEQELAAPCETITRVAIAPVQYAPIGGFGRWSGDVPGFVQERLYALTPELGRQYGVEVCEREGLPVIAAEQALANDPMFDAQSFSEQGQGQGASAMILCTVTRCSLDTKRTNFSIGGGRTRLTVDQTAVTATVWVQARIPGVGRIVVSSAAEGRGVATATAKGDVGVGERRRDVAWGMPEAYQGRPLFTSPNMGECGEAEISALTEAADKAIRQMLQKLLPGIGQTTAMREGWRFDPVTGQPIGPVHCPTCDKEMPRGAKFCPFDGSRLGRNRG